jgi:hypothetical protein
MELVHLTHGSAVLCDMSSHPIKVDDSLFHELRQWLISACWKESHDLPLHESSISALQAAVFPSLFALQVAVCAIAGNVPYPSPPAASWKGVLASRNLPRTSHVQLYRAILFAKLRQHAALRYEVLASLVFEQHCVAPEAAEAPFDVNTNYRGYLVNEIRTELSELEQPSDYR